MKLYICYHKSFPEPDGEIFQPIQVGKKIAETALPMIGDDTGDNISEKNLSFCELTATYWIWKNVREDIVGLFHYRRYLNLRTKDTKFHRFSDDFAETYGLRAEHIKKLLKQYDVLLPVQLPRRIKDNRPSVYQGYAAEHVAADMDCMLDILAQKYPEMKETAEKVLKDGKQSYMTNILVARKELFDEYAAWLFDILFEVERLSQEDVASRDSYQRRAYGFLAERMMKIFIAYKQQTVGLKVAEFPMLYYETDAIKWFKYQWKHWLRCIRQRFSR